MNNENERVWVPKEIKQRDVIFFHLPVIKRPVTKRELIYAIPGIIISSIFLVVSLTILKSNNALNITNIKNIKNLILVITIALYIPIFFAMLSQKDFDGIYIEKYFAKKVIYKKNASVTLNRKALMYKKRCKK